MYDIDEIELRRLDLTVLLVFLNLMRLGKATDVAERMGLTQSSISHSIKRLRDAFGDELFLRTPKGMEPTSVARGLEPRIQAAVDALTEALARPAEFDPSTATGAFRVGAYDNEMTTLVPGLIQRLKDAAPGLRLSVRPIGRKDALAALTSHQIDMALGFIWDLPKDFEALELYQENYRVICRKGHPQAGTLSNLNVYCRADHVIVSPAGDFTGVVDRELEHLGRSRRVTVSLPLFLPAMALVSESDAVATLPARLVARYRKLFRLEDNLCPVTLRSFQVSAIIHRRDQHNPLHQWIVGLLRSEVDKSQ